MAQLVKNPPAMRETWVRSPGREDPLVKGKTIGFESGKKPTKQTNPKTKVVFLYISNEQVGFET